MRCSPLTRMQKAKLALLCRWDGDLSLVAKYQHPKFDREQGCRNWITACHKFCGKIFPRSTGYKIEDIIIYQDNKSTMLFEEKRKFFLLVQE